MKYDKNHDKHNQSKSDPLKPEKHLNPHDHFVRHMMAKPKVWVEFFEKNLPEEIKKIVDLSSIQIQKESFINDKLKLQITDLLYTATFNGKKGYIYLLVEHQSSAKRLMPFRLAKYIMRIMDWHLQRENTEVLPLIYPIIFYTGKKPYRYSTDFFDLFDDKDLAKEVLLQPYKVIDLAQTGEAELSGYLWYGMLAKTMKHVFDPDINDFLKVAIADIKIIENSGDEDYIYTAFSYIFATCDIKNYEEFQGIVINGLSDMSGEKIMTFAERMRMEGYQDGVQEGKTFAERMRFEGKQEGKQEGKLEGKQEGVAETQNKIFGALQLIDQNKSSAEIAKLTGLPLEMIEALKKR